MIDAVAYGASVAIAVTYLAVIARRVPIVAFHWANALGCFPIIASEIADGAGPPLILTVLFGLAGWLGVLGWWKLRR